MNYDLRAQCKISGRQRADYPAWCRVELNQSNHSKFEARRNDEPGQVLHRYRLLGSVIPVCAGELKFQSDTHAPASELHNELSSEVAIYLVICRSSLWTITIISCTTGLCCFLESQLSKQPIVNILINFGSLLHKLIRSARRQLTQDRDR